MKDSFTLYELGDSPKTEEDKEKEQRDNISEMANELGRDLQRLTKIHSPSRVRKVEINLINPMDGVFHFENCELQLGSGILMISQNGSDYYFPFSSIKHFVVQEEKK